MTDNEAREAARKIVREKGVDALDFEGGRVVRLDDPGATGYAVEMWVYVMDGEGD
jgi:hypothetical protein